MPSSTYYVTVRSKAHTHERVYLMEDELDRWEAMRRAASRWERETGRDDSFVSGCEERPCGTLRES